MILPLIAATTAAVATHVELNADKYSGVYIVANGLAGAEEIDIFIHTSNGWLAYENAAGAAQVLTATITQMQLPGYLRYGFLKDGTVGATTLDAYLQQSPGGA